jgi:uncharacterized protein YxjI
MKLLVKQRAFSWTDSYDVYDENEKQSFCRLDTGCMYMIWQGTNSG